MVIAVCAFGLALHPDRRRVGTGIGSAAPTPRRARDAEEFLGEALDEGGFWDAREPVPDAVATAVRRAGAPRPRRRSTTCAARAAYRRHALSRDGPPHAALGLERLPGTRGT